MTKFPEKQLLPWFEKNSRDLPWRRNRTPYAAWVSEIMLQQTQVRQVEPYYRRFMEWFPEIRTLAKARIDKVLKAWEGMGYYSRARNLHQTAKMVVKQFDGKLPTTVEQLIQLPGIGRSTAGAILSLVYNQPLPILDGNVKRVLIRVFNIRKEPRKPSTIRELWDLAAALLPAQQPGLFNEALMELGALICRPKDPDCPHCPIKRKCLAYAQGNPPDLPLKVPGKKIPHYDVTAAVIRRGNKILITQRPEKGLLGGLWEFPGGKREKEESLAECLKREIKEELDLEIQVEEAPFLKVKHAYSHFRITLHCFFCRRPSGRIKLKGVKDFRWVFPFELVDFAFPRADQKVIAYLTAFKS